MKLNNKQLQRLAKQFNLPQFAEAWIELEESNSYPDEIVGTATVNAGTKDYARGEVMVDLKGRVTMDSYTTSTASEGSIIRREGFPKWSK